MAEQYTILGGKSRAGVAEWHTQRTQGKLECSSGKPAMQNCSNSGKPQMAIPSQARRDTSREGVETRRAAPKLRIFRGRVKG